MIKEFIGNKPYIEVQRREDGDGVYRLTLEVSGEHTFDGDPIQYDYIRAGEHPEGNSSETAIDVIFLDSNRIPAGGNKVASYEDGVWKKEAS